MQYVLAILPILVPMWSALQRAWLAKGSVDIENRAHKIADLAFISPGRKLPDLAGPRAAEI